MQEKQTYNLVWFRNDLRIRDNENLLKAIRSGKPIIAFYCFDKRWFEINEFGFKKTEKFRAKFLIETVNDLKISLAHAGIDVIIKFGITEVEIEKLSKHYTISTIFLQNEWTSEELDVENALKKRLPDVKIEKSYSQFLVQPNDFLSITNNIPNSFSSFRKKIEKYIIIRDEYDLDLSKIKTTNIAEISDVVDLETLGFTSFTYDKRSAFPFKGGETSGLNRLEDYIFSTQKVLFYKQTRNGLVGVNYSTKFSSWLANGSLSAVSIYHKIKDFERSHQANQSTYWVIFELLWRDFFKFMGLKYQNRIFFQEGIQNRELPWLCTHEAIEKWIYGKTPCDFVNANMLELLQTGWMSNRGRQNVASYFTKQLYQDWRIGAAYFESKLIDYDVHSNYGNWMYVAGVGNDSRDRKFNTQLQAQNYDANRKFRKRWLQPQLF